VASVAKRVYRKPLLTVVEIAARELLGTGPEPPPEDVKARDALGADVLTEDIEGY